MGNGETGLSNFKIRKSLYTDWQTVLKNPGDIRIEVLYAGNVSGTVHKMMELNDEQKKEYENRMMKAPLFAYLIYHEKQGDYLVDTGFDSIYSEKPWGHFMGSSREATGLSLENGKGIEIQLDQRGIKLKGVFCTHFHEHQGGAPSLPDDIPFIFGNGEEEMNNPPYIYSRFLEDKTNKQIIDFDMADEMPMVGKAVDIFGDGSFWAIDTHGHTRGHISYLINGIEGQYMITGDICMCLKGYEIGVESGHIYAADPEQNRESFLKINKLLKAFPQIKPLFGHETEEHRIVYVGTVL